MSMNRKMKRAAGRKTGGGVQQVEQLANLLGQLAPGLAQMEQELGKVAGIGPNLQQVHAEWEEVITTLRAELAELRKRQVEQDFRTMAVIHDIVTGDFPSDPAMTFEDFLARVQQYTQPPESGT